MSSSDSLHFPKQTNCRRFWMRSDGSFRKLLGAKTPVRRIHHQPLKAKAKPLATVLVGGEDINASVWISPINTRDMEYAFMSFTVGPSLS